MPPMEHAVTLPLLLLMPFSITIKAICMRCGLKVESRRSSTSSRRTESFLRGTSGNIARWRHSMDHLRPQHNPKKFR